MNIDITIHAVKDAHGICAIHPEATIWFSPKEGFDADKLRRTEEDLTAMLTSRLNDALGLGGEGEAKGGSEGGRNCDRYREADDAYKRFCEYVKRVNPACLKPSPLFTVMDVLEWVLADGVRTEAKESEAMA